MQSFPSLVHDVPSVSLFDWQTPLPLQVSGLSQSVSELLPHAVPEGTFVWAHAPDAQASVVQSFESLVHDVPLVSLFD